MSFAGSESFERDVRSDLQERPLYAFLERLMGVEPRGNTRTDV